MGGDSAFTRGCESAFLMQVIYSSSEYFLRREPLELRRVKKTRQSTHKNIIGERVRLSRLAMKPRVSQEDLSGKLARLGVQITQTGISKIESGDRYVMDYEAAALAKALRVPISTLFEKV
jgi:hypothetical protein